MVMHARKPQRISDGYFEKHQAHPYQKYNSKTERRAGNDYVSSDPRYTPLRSPNGNVSLHSHNTHPSQSTHSHHQYNVTAEERGYPTWRNSYQHKGTEKERDRDFKSSRNKYAESVNSPMDRYKNSDRERSNHERSETEKKNRTSGVNVSVSRSNKYGKRCAPSTSKSEWSEHISSSGKRYYFNCVSEVSQWEKPRDWDTRRILSKDSTHTSKNNNEKSSSRSGRKESEKPSKRSNNNSDRYWNNSNRDEEIHNRTRRKLSGPPNDVKEGQALQDMDISPDRSTPLSENSYGVRGTNSKVRNNSDSNTVPPVVVLDNSSQQSGSLLAAALPRIVGGPPAVSTSSSTSLPPSASPVAGFSGATPDLDRGPPTPTHSENTDPHAPPLHLNQALPRKMECLGSYSSVVGGTLHHAPPMLTPSLVNYVRTDLTSHVTGWPADILERQANKYSEEAYQLGSLHCTRVSAELKCARSLVRHTEIRATLQEQKIMYLRQQISRLEELKSQNSFMSED